MPHKDLRQFIDQIKLHDRLQVVEGADPELEVSAIAAISARQPHNPALLFDRFAGFPAGYRVLMNQSASLRRVALLYDLPPGLSKQQYTSLFRERLRAFSPFSPQEVKDGPVMENAASGKDVNMLKFPVPRWNELDGGPYIGTRDAVISRDPDSGWINLGTYRVQRFDDKTLGQYISPGHHGRIMREKYWARGENAPAVMIFGGSPIYSDVGSIPFPWEVEELSYIGYLDGEPLKVIRGPITGLPIPYDVEIAVEGEVPPPSVESRTEGPFGEWTGY